MPENDAQTPGGTPRWVKVFGIVALVVVVVVVVMLITGRGDHDPGRHTVSGDSRATALFAVVRQP